MIGLVLAAGAGRRLRPYTDALPKALVPVSKDASVLDHILANFAAVGLSDVAIVVGYRAETLEARRQALQERHGVRIELLVNDRAEEWNNAYSLWCARHLFGNGVLLANGDTLHPGSVERTLLDARGSDRTMILAVDDIKPLAEEEMKVIWSAADGVTAIHKELAPAAATGEYIGVTLIEPAAADPLADALQATFQRDPQLYYEDGYAELIARGHRIDAATLGELDWVEIDDHDDLVRAREIACHC